MTLTAYVGSFTTAQREARGEGILVYRVDPATGAFAPVQTLGGLVNPSYLALRRDQRVLYAVHGDEAYATSYAIDPATGRIAPLNTADCGGGNGVRQAIDATGRWMVVANYAAGTVAVLEIRADGTLADQHQRVTLEGPHGPHPTQQTAAHPHDVVFDATGTCCVVPDKGLDRSFCFRLDATTGRLTQTGVMLAQAGAGPRHMAFHPTRPVAWVLNELDSSITTCRWDPAAATLTAIETIGTLPADFTAYSTTAEIAVSADGRFVLCSNRGHDSVTRFAVGDDGRLSVLGWTKVGQKPRFIGFTPRQRFLCAAAEQGDVIDIFRFDAATGNLTPTGQSVPCRSPACIVFTGDDA